MRLRIIVFDSEAARIQIPFEKNLKNRIDSKYLCPVEKPISEDGLIRIVTRTDLKSDYKFFSLGSICRDNVYSLRNS
ncbi:hypothetical protein DLM78_04685 [Leptospira stimsonii]|uniref:Uncharacterized protein n=1 Tax=Leptospira stimsonii TaxID=2202203 RepID=A0A8B3CVM6_9LEPT|nr:hypothetical protein DLM78_04685 [Leptospira stimsonii]